jgi:SNF2 family DNA or RNA helicase
MKAELHGYQDLCVSWLARHAAAGLLLDMGLGKTLIVLTTIIFLKTLGVPLGKVLVIAPLRVASHTWPSEMAKWDHTNPLTYSLVVGTKQERLSALEQEADLYITNRENVCWLVEACEEGWPFETLVIDELSSFKNHATKRWRALRKVRPQVKRVWGLTGTPAPNGLHDLWAEVYLLDQGERLGGRIGGYRDRYCYPQVAVGHVVYRWGVRQGAESEIYTLLSDLVVSMRSKDVLRLPGRVVNDIPVTLSDAEAKAYRRLEREYVLELNGEDITAANAAGVVAKCLQAAGGAVYTDDGGYEVLHDRKLEALSEVIEGSGGQPVLVYYAYRHDLARIRERFPEAVPIDTKGAIDDWNKGQVPMLLAHPQSAGHGLNLQEGGHIIVWFGLTFNLESYDQACARLDRQGQRETVIIHRLVAEHTIDERVLGVLEGKGTLQEAVLDALRKGGL